FNAPQPPVNATCSLHDALPISGQGGNNSYDSERESTRITGFVTHDFAEGDRDNWFTRLLGSHTLTGLWAEDEQNTDNRSWNRYADRKSTRLNSSHVKISYAVFC